MSPNLEFFIALIIAMFVNVVVVVGIISLARVLW